MALDKFFYEIVNDFNYRELSSAIKPLRRLRIPGSEYVKSVSVDHRTAELTSCSMAHSEGIATCNQNAVKLCSLVAEVAAMLASSYCDL